MRKSDSSTNSNLGYIISLPERALRAFAVVVGGLFYETFQVLLPDWIKRSRLYKATIGGLLRLIIEFLGGQQGIIPKDEITPNEFAMRKAAGTGIELASILTLGLSPVWLLAAAADITGGARTYLGALVSQLQHDGLLADDVDITSVEELLDTLEGTSGQMAEMADVPPLNVEELRNSWNQIKLNAAALPDAGRLERLYKNLQAAARQEGIPLDSLSRTIAIGAAKAGMKMGQLYLFDYYHLALGLIAKEGLTNYSKRVYRPYLLAAREHLNPQGSTFTQRFMQRSKSQRLE